MSSSSSPAKRRRLAEACREMSERFLRGGRLLAFGRGPYATDAQHVSVEFVHPGHRRQACAACARSCRFCFVPGSKAILHPEDIVMGFGPPEGDPEVWAGAAASPRGEDAMTFALPGMEGSYALDAPTDPFIHQEMIEILYHTLWETVHVFFEHRELGHEVGEAGFLYPFLGRRSREPETCWPKSRPRS